MFDGYPSTYAFADLQCLQASEATQATIPSTLLIISYRPDIVVYNSEKCSVALPVL